MKVSEISRELEKTFARIRVLKGELLSFDGYDRWGHGTDAEKEAAAQEASRRDKELKNLEAALTARIGALRQSEPRTVSEWAEAHISLLQKFVREMQVDAVKYGTEIFVAKEELAMWNKVIQGVLPFADVNVFYVHYPAELYQEFFG